MKLILNISEFAMFRLLILAVAISAAPLPYYTRSLVETPTSRVEQHLLLSPQLQQTYRIQPQHVQSFSNFEFPKQQVVYYYPQNHHLQQPLNLYELRQDSPWWQELWNQLVGPELGGEEESEPDEDDDEQPISSPQDEVTDLNKKPDLELQATTVEPTTSEPQNDEISNKIAPKEDTESISVEASPEPQNPHTNRNLPQYPQTPLHQVYSHNHQFYVANGAPEFYGNFDVSFHH
jgi:hypothetical protein